MIDKLIKAKAALILDQPFYATLLLSMPVIERNDIPTMATDGERMFYNSKFVESLTVPEITFVLAHEVLHAVMLHTLRRGERNHNKYNQAADYVINDLLVKEKVGVMPALGLLNDELVKKGEYQSEKVYNLLPDSDSDKGTGQEGGAMDDLIDNPDCTDEASQSQMEAEMKVKVLQAANVAKMQGKLSAGLERLVKEATEPKVNWKRVLREFFTSRAKVDWTFAKPKRRFIASDIYLPGLTGEQLGDVVIAVDCSGSIDEKVLGEFSREIRTIIEDCCPTNTHVIYFDAKVLRHDVFEKDNEFNISAVGGGGTAFSPVFEYMIEKQINPEVCVFLTDLCCNDFGNAPECSVLWATTYSTDAPFGDVLKMDNR